MNNAIFGVFSIVHLSEAYMIEHYLKHREQMNCLN